MNEWMCHARVATNSLLALFLGACVLPAMFFLLRGALGNNFAAALGVAASTLLILSVLVVAFFYRPRTHLTPGTRVLIYALGVLSSGFAIVTSGQFLDLGVAALNAALRWAVGPESPVLSSGGDYQFYFALLCGTVFGVSVLAVVLDRPALTVLPTSVISPQAALAPPPPHRARFVVEALLLPALAVGFYFALEARSDVCFAEPAGSTGAPDLLTSDERYWLSGACAANLALLYYTLVAVRIWFRRDQTVREEYALYAFATCAAAGVVAVVTFVLWDADRLGVAPWTSVRTCLGIALNRPLQRPQEGAIHLFSTLLVLGVLSFLFRSGYQEWTEYGGRKSTEHHRQQQRSEKPKLYREGWRTWGRVLLGRPLPTAYEPPPAVGPPPSNPPVLIPEAWKDRACDLVRLQFRSYEFDRDRSWHDAHQCWVGHNIDTDKRVLLFVADGSNAELLRRQVVYIDELAGLSGPPIGDIIFATTECVAALLTEWRGVTISWKSEGNLLDTLVNFEDYRRAIRQRVRVQKLPDSEVTISDVYTESEIELPNGAGLALVEKYLNEWNTKATGRQLALLGEYGQGKSTAALMWVYHCIENPQPGDRLPLLIELRGLSPRTLTREQLLGAWAVRYNINASALMRLVVAGRITLIFEGFDEMDLVGDSEMRLRHFQSLWTLAVERSKILFTGRPNLFFTTPELARALRSSPQLAGNAHCDELKLIAFDPERIAESLRAYPLEVREQIPKKARTNDQFRELVSRPSLLHVVATLWVDEQLAEKNPDELTSAYVLDLFIKKSYRRQGHNPIGPDNYGIGLTLDELAYFMRGISVYMATNGLENQIPHARLRDAFDQLFEAIPDAVSAAPRGGGATAEPLRQRITNDHQREGIFAAVHTAGLLVSDPAAAGKFCFAHKSFMEFMTADVLAVKLFRPEEEAEAAICNATGATSLTLFKLPVAVRFFSELAASLLRVERTEAGNPDEVFFALARKLFHKLVAQYNPVTRLEAFVVMTQMALMQIDLLEGTKRRSLFRRIVLFGHFLFATCMGATIVLCRPAYFSNIFLLVAALISIQWLLTFTVWLPISQRTRNIKGVLWTRIASWRAVCWNLGVPDSILHRVAGTSWWPWTRNLPFRLCTLHDTWRMSSVLSNHTGFDKFSELREGLLKMIDDWYCRNPAGDSEVLSADTWHAWASFSAVLLNLSGFPVSEDGSDS